MALMPIDQRATTSTLVHGCPRGGIGRRTGAGIRGRPGMRVRISSQAPSVFTSKPENAMRSFKADMQKLLERRAYLITQMKELRDRLAELDLTIALLRGEAEP